MPHHHPSPSETLAALCEIHRALPSWAVPCGGILLPDGSVETCPAFATHSRTEERSPDYVLTENACDYHSSAEAGAREDPNHRAACTAWEELPANVVEWARRINGAIGLENKPG